jgi:hypothetical protein
MKAGNFFLISTIFLYGAMLCAQAGGEAGAIRLCTPKENVDWTRLNPVVLDMAFDLLEDLSLQADALDKSDEVYSPREADTEKLWDKINRIKTRAFLI